MPKRGEEEQQRMDKEVNWAAAIELSNIIRARLGSDWTQRQVADRVNSAAPRSNPAKVSEQDVINWVSTGAFPTRTHRGYLIRALAMTPEEIMRWGYALITEQQLPPSGGE
jgi:hypothetical protein